MNGDILSILEHIEREKGIDKEVLFQAIQSALMSAARKIVGKNVEDISVEIDKKTGEIKVTSEGKEIKSEEFGRIAAQTAKQVIIQKIREAEREVIYDDFNDRITTLCTGAIHRVDKGNYIVDLGKTEGILMRKETCPRDSYKQGDRVRALILDVRKTTKGPQIILSRTHPMFVQRLFELEVPEIDEGIVEIRGIAREAGDRTKLAVFSNDEKVDSVGACVGMRGQRVKNIVRELGGERIDIIRWNEDSRDYIKGALSPAEIASIDIDKENQRARVTVEDDQLSLAIGKQGQNVRLASKLTGWSIDIRSKKELKTLEMVSILSIEAVGKKAKDILEQNGYDTIDKIANAKVEELTALPGIGEKSAKKMIESAKDVINRLKESEKEQKNQEKSAKAEGMDKGPQAGGGSDQAAEGKPEGE
ncbi:MAG: transcription termination/antitermination protein NusA [Candidatus Omnitrophica bacterium]|nr:transcription termination/antitermination protein NusA [Candidatus Omnitrophota bacterium]